MGIKDVGANEKSSAPLRSNLPLRSRKGSAPQEGKVSSQEDFFEKSGRLGAVRALIDSLVQVPEIRTDVVDSARERLASGELDSPESAAKAARAFLEGSR